MIKSVFINDLNEHKQNYKPSNGVQAEREGERGWQQEGQVGGKCRGPSKKEQAAAWGGGGRKGGFWDERSSGSNRDDSQGVIEHNGERNGTKGTSSGDRKNGGALIARKGSQVG